MATITSRVCDIDKAHEGEVEQVVFGVGGEHFTADLCPKDRTALDKALEPYAKVGMPISAREALRGGNGAIDPSVVRAWALRTGKYQLGERGRIPAEVVKDWRAETGN
jgi:hypothetical protein